MAEHASATQTWGVLPHPISIAIRPFQIDAEERRVKDLFSILEATPALQKTHDNDRNDMSQGITHQQISEALSCWKSSYSWREQEKHLNRHPQFIADVPRSENASQTDTIHFMGLFSSRPDATPILLLHGWPSSFLEFGKVLDLVRSRNSPDQLPYHIIVPSLTGFGFSSGPPLEQAWTNALEAEKLNALMEGLGFGNDYIISGSDIGSFVARIMAEKYDGCKAVHVNYLPAIKPDSVPDTANDTTLTDEDKAILDSSTQFAQTGLAYAMEQGTKPATMSFVLAYNPIGLLAWLGEKILAYSAPETQPSLTELLTTVSLYYLTETYGRSIWSYREAFSSPPSPSQYLKKPFGYSRFPHDTMGVPKSWAAAVGDLRFYKAHSQGGHFAPQEVPEAFWEDVADFVKIVKV